MASAQEIVCCKTVVIHRIDWILFAVYISSLLFGNQLLFPIFLNYKPFWSCEENHQEFSQNCSIWHSCPAENLSYRADYYSAVQEFQLICDGTKEYYAATISTLQFFGALVGAPVSGHLADGCGRRVTFLGTMVAGVILSAATGLASDWRILAGLRFAVGFCAGGVLTSGQPFVYELLQPYHRIFLRCFFNWGWCRLVFTFICFLVPHWRQGSLALATVGVPGIVLTLLFIPESYKWLESKGKLNEAQNSYLQIQRFNKIKIEETSSADYNPSLAYSDHIYTVRDLFRTKNQSVHSGTILFMFFAVAVASYTNDLNSGTLAGNLFINQVLFSVITGLSKVPLFFLDTYVEKFNRRHLHHIPQVAVILCYVASVIFTLLKLPGVTVIFANLVGTIFIEFTWDACCLCTVEGFPTVIRSIGMGTGLLMARLGSILAPQIIYLKNYWEPAAFATVAGISFCSLVISYLFLPNTKGIALMDTISDQLHTDEIMMKTERERNTSSS